MKVSSVISRGVPLSLHADSFVETISHKSGTSNTIGLKATSTQLGEVIYLTAKV